MTDPSTEPPTDASGVGSRSGGRSPGRAIAVAVGLGLLGPLIAVVSATTLGFVNALVGLPLVVLLVLGLFFGQYVAFAGLAVGYLAYRGFDLPRIRAYFGIEWPTLREVGLVIGGWLAIIVSLVIVATAVRVLGVEPASNRSAELAMQRPEIIPILILASFLVIGPCEELLYRGVVQGRIRESLPGAPSILIASAVFAFVHFMALTGGASARLTTVAILFVPSLVFGAIYEYTGNLVVPALLHGLHNAVLFTLLYVALTAGADLAEGGSTVLVFLG